LAILPGDHGIPKLKIDVGPGSDQVFATIYVSRNRSVREFITQFL
jgi:hypothetical protein